MNGEDIKLDKAQRARAVDLEPQVIDDPEWACAAIVWQRDQLADRDAEIVNLRARLDAEASHRLSLCADNERFIAEIEMLKRRIDAQHAANGELAVDLKEWRIRFPSNDPQIARRMVEDRAVAEANMDNAGLLAEIERLRADLVWAVMRKASFDPERRLFEFDQHDGAAEDGSEDDSGGMFPIDGTPDSICRAVREARDGVS